MEEVPNHSEEIFDAVREHGGQLPEEMQMRDDLTEEQRESIEQTKEATRAAREVVLQEERVVEMLENELERLALQAGMEGGFLERLGIPDEYHSAITRDLSEMADHLRSTPIQELFDTIGLDLETYREDLNQYLTVNLTNELLADIGPFEGSKAQKITTIVQALMRAEVQMGIKRSDDVQRRPILAHRARGFGETEASYESLEQALREGVVEMEFDIRMSSDHVPIIHHNATLGALANRPEAIHQLTAAELTALPLTSGERLATLEDCCRLIQETDNRGTKINIDIKDFDQSMLDEIIRLVDEYDLEHRVTLVSWHPQALQYIYEQRPTWPYSLSYFPSFNGVTDSVCNWLNRGDNGYESGVRRMGWLGRKLASTVSAWRGYMAKRGTPPILGTGGEQITDAYVLDPNMHWRDLVEYADTHHENLYGKHTMTIGDIFGQDPEGTRMSRVLRNGGSLNIMSLQETLNAVTGKVPTKTLRSLVRGALAHTQRAIIPFAERCAALGISVNVFDLKKPQSIASHFGAFEAEGLQAGVVYSSNPEEVPRLQIRPLEQIV